MTSTRIFATTPARISGNNALMASNLNVTANALWHLKYHHGDVNVDVPTPRAAPYQRHDGKVMARANAINRNHQQRRVALSSITTSNPNDALASKQQQQLCSNSTLCQNSSATYQYHHL